MSKTDSMRWRDWAKIREPRRCRCGAKFMPDVPRQRFCRPCAQREADKERAPVTAQQVEQEKLLRLLDQALAADARRRPIPLAEPRSDRAKLERRAARTMARVTVPTMPQHGGQSSPPPRWAPVARRKIIQGWPLRKIAKMLDVSVEDVRLWGAATVAELRYRAAVDHKLGGATNDDRPRADVSWCWAKSRGSCHLCAVGIFPRDRMAMVDEKWVHAACAVEAGYTVVSKAGEPLDDDELSARRKRTA